MNREVQHWQVIFDGRKHRMIHDHLDTDHRVLSKGLTHQQASAMVSAKNADHSRKAVGNFITGLMHVSAEAAGHCVKTVKEGYDKGRR
ncbi:hypothetical protein [Brevundimonas vesicularis]|uniref:hypothetical protein n=1 Tax=Brevundimonas vesicularis TaxID=41276 RepID=UPI0028A7B8BF|nr:hypothetical protein [Brevundimonas vesicularis]